MFLHYLLYPEDTGAGSGLSELDQDLTELGDDKPVEKPDDDDDVDETGEVEEKGEEEKPDEEEEEEEEVDKKEDEEEDEDEKEEVALERDAAGRPTVKAIKGKYPDLFKDFPEIKHAFFAVQKYEEVFADAEQAKEASIKASEYDALENALVGQGDPSLLIKTLNENNPRALKKVISNFHQAIKTHAPEEYLELTTPIIEELCFHAAKYGDKVGGQTGRNLKLAAQHIANYVFANGGDIPDISRRSKPEQSEAERQLEKERAQYAEEKFHNAVSSILVDADKIITGVITNKLSDLTSFERKSIIKDSRSELDNALKSDKAFQASLTRLWESAKQENYSPASKERIKNAWLSRAKQVAIPIRNRLRQEALDARSGESTKPNEEKEKKRTFPTKGGQGRRGGASRVLDPHKIDWKRTSDIDILNKD